MIKDPTQTIIDDIFNQYTSAYELEKKLMAIRKAQQSSVKLSLSNDEYMSDSLSLDATNDVLLNLG